MFSLPTLATVPPLRLAHEHEATGGEGLSGLFFRSAGMNNAAIETDGLFMLIFWFSVFFFVLLMILMVWWGFFKYRRARACRSSGALRATTGRWRSSGPSSRRRPCWSSSSWASGPTPPGRSARATRSS
jgi:cytoskeletal protein RodZ